MDDIDKKISRLKAMLGLAIATIAVGGFVLFILQMYLRSGGSMYSPEYGAGFVFLLFADFVALLAIPYLATQIKKYKREARFASRRLDDDYIPRRSIGSYDLPPEKLASSLTDGATVLGACELCKKPVRKFEDHFQCLHCNYLIHRTHLSAFLKEQNQCLRCKTPS